mgnify:FL=1
MELILKRIAKRKTYTIGHLYVEGKSEGKELSSEVDKPNVQKAENSINDGMTTLSADASYICDTLEPTWRDYKHGQRKIPGRSAIPEGRYAVVISWSPKMKRWLPILLGGPEFNRQWAGVRIHAGNTAQDTAGCILVGENTKVGMVLNSRNTLHRVKQLITEAKERDEAVHLTVM